MLSLLIALLISHANATNFLSVQELHRKVDAVVKSTYEANKKATPDKFLEALKKKNGGLFHFFDCPEKFDIPVEYARKLVTDHHGEYFDEKKPKLDSTMQLLSMLESTPKAKLKERFETVSTDNFGDGMEAVFIAHNLDAFYGNKDLIGAMYAAEYFVDFGVFGGTDFEKNPSKAMMAVFPDKAITFRNAFDGIVIGKAILQFYSELITEFRITLGDRFHEISPGVERPLADQQAIVKRAMEGLARIILSPDTSYRKQLAAKFESNRAKATQMVIANKVPLESRAFFAHFAIESESVGLFPAWAAPSNAHSLPFTLSIRPNIGPNKSWTGFILSNVDGREIDSVDLRAFGKRIQEIHSANSPSDKAAYIGGRKTLQFSFTGADVSTEQLLAETVRATAH